MQSLFFQLKIKHNVTLTISLAPRTNPQRSRSFRPHPLASQLLTTPCSSQYSPQLHTAPFTQLPSQRLPRRSSPCRQRPSYSSPRNGSLSPHQLPSPLPSPQLPLPQFPSQRLPLTQMHQCKFEMLWSFSHCKFEMLWSFSHWKVRSGHLDFSDSMGNPPFR